MIDLRSDTLTKPSDEMKKAMFQAEVGDDVYGEDPTVNKLEIFAAEIMGKENALFVASGTQSNLLALLTHCGRGDEYIAGQHAHMYKYEGGGAAALGGIQPQPIDFEDNSTLDLEKVRSYIKKDDYHFARTKLLCIENTQSGKALPMSYLKDVKLFAATNKLNTHLDGARAFNAAAKLNVDITAITNNFETVSICLSKGLGAPVGSVLCGSKDFIKEARRWRKVLGGGMRQAGSLAAACIYALTNNIHRLNEDHDNAQLLATELQKIDDINVEYNSQQTNMVFIHIDPKIVDSLNTFMISEGIMISAEPYTRLVTHLNISHDDILKLIDAFQRFFKR